MFGIFSNNQQIVFGAPPQYHQWTLDSPCLAISDVKYRFLDKWIQSSCRRDRISVGVRHRRRSCGSTKGKPKLGGADIEN